MKKILLIILTSILFISCGDYKLLDDARKVRVGMTATELKSVMGEPWTVNVESDKEEWIFTYYVGDNVYVGCKMRMSVDIINGKVYHFYSY